MLSGSVYYVETRTIVLALNGGSARKEHNVNSGKVVSVTVTNRLRN